MIDTGPPPPNPPTQASVFGAASQATFLTDLGAASDGSAVSGAGVFGSGVARAEGRSETRSRFFADVPFFFLIQATVNCAGENCDSFVTLLGADDLPLFVLRATSGSGSDSFTASLAPNQAYTLWARASSISTRNAAGTVGGGGSYSLVLQFADGPITTPVPEPASALLLACGWVWLVLRSRSVAR